MTTSRFTLSRLRLLCLLAVIALVVGCSQGIKKVTVNGTISYKGKRLSSGVLRAIGPEGSYSAAVIQTDGTFILTDVVPGEITVGIMDAPQGSGSSSGEGSSKTSAPVNLPDKYRHPEKSDLKYKIEPSTRQLDIDIK